MSIEPVVLFLSYSHKDEIWRERLVAHLAVMRREKLISPWHDRKIVPGAEWNEAIRAELNAADIIVLLLSPDFLASDYCNDHEIPAAMARHDSGAAVVIPVHLRPCDWIATPIAKLQAFPPDARPVESWTSYDEALLTVAKGVRAVAERILEERKRKLGELEEARMRYRKKVEETLDDGIISTGERDTLDELRLELGLTLDDTRRIESQAQAPLKKLAEAQAGYRKTLAKILEAGWPISAVDLDDLKLRKRDLGLKDQDVEDIDSAMMAQAESRHELERMALTARDAPMRLEPVRAAFAEPVAVAAPEPAGVSMRPPLRDSFSLPRSAAPMVPATAAALPVMPAAAAAAAPTPVPHEAWSLVEPEPPATAPAAKRKGMPRWLKAGGLLLLAVLALIVLSRFL